MAAFAKPMAPVTAPKPAITTPGSAVLTRNMKQPAKSNAWVFSVAGLRGSVRIAKALLATEAPATLTISGVAFTTPTPKLSAEERKAARAALTPQQRIDIERQRVARAQDRLARAEKAARS